MTEVLWNAVDRYFSKSLSLADPVLEAALAASEAAGLPPIAVSATQGKMLALLATLSGARRILEVGTLGGYSTIWLARTLAADGRLVTLEVDPKHLEVARANVQHAGVADRVEFRLGAALETLPELAIEAQGPFDFIFIDADKTNIPEYFDWAVKLSRPGTAIVVDNVVRKGAVANPASDDPSVLGVRRFFAAAGKDSRVTLTALQTVGAKGYDGFALAVVQHPGG